MKRLTYRLYVDVPEVEPLKAAQRATEDALEALVVNGRTVEYHLIGTAEGLPEPTGEARWEPGMPPGVIRTGADL